MKANVGSIDRLIRVVLGLALLSLIFILTGPIKWVGLIGVVPLLTAAISYCPLYKLVGIDSRSLGI